MFLYFVFALSVTQALDPTNNWMSIHKDDWCCRTARMFCPLDSSSWMTGMCSSGKNPDCSYNSYNRLHCSQLPEAVRRDVDAERWVLTDSWGKTISCDFKKMHSAVGMCASAGRRDCRCTGTRWEGCDDPRKWRTHLLRCGPGVHYDVDKLIEVASNFWGQDLRCPSDHVVVSMCSSGMNMDCTSRKGTKVSNLIVCAPILESPATKINYIKGFWKHLNGFDNEEFEVKKVTVHTTLIGQEMSRDRASEYTLGGEASVTVEAGTDMFGVEASVSATVGFSYSETVSNSVSRTASRFLESGVSEERVMLCGEDDIRFSLWQWNILTETADGEKGPYIKTNTFLCRKGGENDVDRPRCSPGFCINDNRCDVCTYDYCDVGSVLSAGEYFNYVYDCVDLIMGAGKRRNRVPYVIEQQRDGDTVWTGPIVFINESGRRNSGSAAGQWRVGDKFRIVPDWEL